MCCLNLAETAINNGQLTMDNEDRERIATLINKWTSQGATSMSFY